MNIYPIKLISVPKQIIWGGERLSRYYNKTAPFKKIAESWELTIRPDGVSVIANGVFSGKTLQDYLKCCPNALGTNASEDSFPLLIKFIDAEDDLSIQVHPDDGYATNYESESGKTEMWYVAEADEGASIIYGIKKEIVQENIKDLFKDTVTCDALNKICIKKGDVFFIPSGHVHAICKGALIAEIQQNSNVTYRIYDYERTDSEGKKRELHLNKALDVIRHRTSCEIDSLQFCGNILRRDAFAGTNVLTDCSYFRVSKICCDGIFDFYVDSTSFASLLFLEAESASVTCGDTETVVYRGDSIFIPAGSGNVRLSGKCELLLTEA